MGFTFRDVKVGRGRNKGQIMYKAVQGSVAGYPTEAWVLCDVTTPNGLVVFCKTKPEEGWTGLRVVALAKDGRTVFAEHTTEPVSNEAVFGGR